MTHRNLTGNALCLLASLLLATACGGGGGGGGGGEGGVADSRVNLVVPQMQAGEPVDYEIPLDGGCGGPYRVELLDGQLPPGVNIEDGEREGPGGPELRHHLVGYVLEAGEYNARLLVTDTGCDPFYTIEIVLEWMVEDGPVTIVDTSPLSRPADQVEVDGAWPDIWAFPDTIYGDYIVYDFLIAGGQKPYSCQLIDDPADPDDGQLPLGISLLEGSCSLVGSPTELGPNARPWRLTFKVTDANGEETMRKFQWHISTPIMSIATTKLPDGTVGEIYSGILQLSGGVAPFAFELVDDIPTESNEDYVYGTDDTTPPTFNSASGFTVASTGEASNKLNADGGASGGSTATYPAPSASGPFGPMPSEGVYMDDQVAPGTIRGRPRREGDYTLFAHAYSTRVPNAFGQHAFQTVTKRIASTTPIVLDGTVTEEGAYTSSAPYAHFPGFEVSQPYNPDGGSRGLDLLASGGCPADGYTDAPHATQRQLDPSETEGAYGWSIDWDVENTGNGQPSGMTMSAAGVLDTTNPNDLERMGDQAVEVTATDYAMSPTSGSARAYVSVGPDKVIVADSSRSWTGIYNYYNYSNRHEPNNPEITLKVFSAFQSSAVKQDLTSNDLSPTHSVPTAAGLGATSNPLGALLSGATGGDNSFDALRCTINATGYWDDMFGLNPNGARPFTNSDTTRGYVYNGQFGSSYSRHANWQPSISAVGIPDAEGVAHAPQNGVYADGGRLYHFESANRFGVFMIRSDGTIYVPFAMAKSSNPGEGGFGDGLFLGYSTSEQNSALRTVQMTVSPDGRYAAMALRTSPTNVLEAASSSRILIFSLTGEKPFAGSTYKIIDSGVASTGSGSRYLHANSFALTNTHLYFLIGSQTSLSLQAWSSHYLMRYEIASTATSAGLLPVDGTNSNWTQASGIPMQTTYQYSYVSPYQESTTSYGSWPYRRFWCYNGSGFFESSTAPTPFRVSRDGRAVTFMAGANSTSTGSTTTYLNYCWVDFQGSGARQASSTARHTMTGSQRGYTLSVGPQSYAMWGSFQGPTPGLEISDDGLRVAFVYNNASTSATFYASQSYSSSSHSVMRNRDNIMCVSTSSTDQWRTLSSTVQKDVTSTVFGGSHRWRFGSLIFTDDGDGLVFWGGASVMGSTQNSYTYQQSFTLNGTMYSCGNLDSTTPSVKGMFSTANGGSPDGQKSYSSSAVFNPSGTSGLNNRFGTLQPCGGFISKNRKFAYICDLTGISNSRNSGCELVGLNISTLSSGSINGKTNGQGFLLSGFPSRRGFCNAYHSYPAYTWHYSYLYSPNTGTLGGIQTVARDTGWVYWMANYQYAGPYQSTSTSRAGPVIRTYAYGCYAYGGCGVYGFDPNVGGAVATISHPSYVSNSTSSSYYDLAHFIDTTADGKRVFWVTDNGTTSRCTFNRERMYSAWNLDFNPSNGAMHSGFSRTSHSARIETGTGRAGDAAALTRNGRDLWYAFRSGASNENQLDIVRSRIDLQTKALSSPARYSGSSVQGRMSVLYVGR